MTAEEKITELGRTGEVAGISITVVETTEDRTCKRGGTDAVAVASGGSDCCQKRRKSMSTTI